MKTENQPSKLTIAAGQTIKLETRFGGCSRGKCWGKFYPGQTRPKGEFEWVEKSNGVLFLDQPGFYVVGSDDGFARKAKVEFVLTLATETAAV